MAWTDSRVFRRWIETMVANSIAWDWDADTVKVALYNNTTAPDNDATTDVLIGYNGSGSQWVVANEVIDSSGGGTDWPAAGVTLAGKTNDVGTADFVKLDATDTASGATADISGAFGCLVYDDTLTNKPGFCYNYFGGSNSVTAGTFTVVWHANGVIRFAL
jgi:hypothetical protein